MSDVFEPTQYFEELKSNLSQIELKELESQMEAVSEQILLAKKLGQTNMLHKLSFVYQTILKERVLLANGLDIYLHKEDIVKYIESVTPKNSVKIIELDRFPRVIPPVNAEEILKHKHLFDEVCIVFTDFTDDDHQSEADKQVINRNRDPIAFGYFKNESANLRHDRYYFITDWEDEYCDLTLTKLIEELGKLGVKEPQKTIPWDANDHLNQIVVEALADAEKATTRNFGTTAVVTKEKPDNFIKKFMRLFSDGKN